MKKSVLKKALFVVIVCCQIFATALVMADDSTTCDGTMAPTYVNDIEKDED